MSNKAGFIRNFCQRGCFINNNYNQQSTARVLLRSASGPLFALIGVLMVEVLYRAGIRAPIINAAFSISIIYSVFVCGRVSAAITVIICAAYSWIFFSYHYRTFGGFHGFLTAYIANILDFIVLLIAAGIVKKHIGRSNHYIEESEKKYRELFNNANDAIFLCEMGENEEPGRFIEVNDVACKLLGYSRNELLALSAHEITKTESEKRPVLSLSNSETISRWTLECILVSKDGSQIPFELNSNVFMFNGKKVLLAIARDITEHKRSEEALRDSEEKFREVFNNSNDAIFFHELAENPMNVSFIEANSMACRMLGYSKEELLRMTPGELQSTKGLDSDTVYTLIQKQQCTYELRLTSKSGKEVPVEMSTHIFTMKDKYYVISTARDISERIHAQEALKRSEERYSQLFELLPVGVSVVVNGKFAFANKALANILGVSNPAELVGKLKTDFAQLHPDFLEAATVRREKLFAEGVKAPLEECRVIRGDGAVLDIETTAINIEVSEKPAVLSVIRDLSELRKMQKLQRDMDENNRRLNETIELDRLKTEFFANLSHEFRTPLNVILGALQLFELYLDDGSELNAKVVSKHTKIMKQNCQRLMRLVNNLIDATRIDAGFFEIHLQNCNIVGIIEEITLSVAEYMRDKQIELQFDTDVEEKLLACDPDKIERIILNLLSNAVKYTGEGGSIYVNIQDGNDKVTISVRDTGIGIPEEKQNIIFERFRQVDQSLTRKHEGSGIGLSLVKSLVEMHEGKICVKSKYGEGSEFIIEMPAKVLSNADNELIQHNLPPAKRNAHIERISVEFSDIYKAG